MDSNLGPLDYETVTLTTSQPPLPFVSYGTWPKSDQLRGWNVENQTKTKSQMHPSGLNRIKDKGCWTRFEPLTSRTLIRLWTPQQARLLLGVLNESSFVPIQSLFKPVFTLCSTAIAVSRNVSNRRNAAGIEPGTSQSRAEWAKQ